MAAVCISFFQGKTAHLVDVRGDLDFTQIIQMALSSREGLAIGKLDPTLLLQADFSPWPPSHVLLSEELCVLNIMSAFQFLTNIHPTVHFKKLYAIWKHAPGKT